MRYRNFESDALFKNSRLIGRGPVRGGGALNDQEVAEKLTRAKEQDIQRKQEKESSAHHFEKVESDELLPNDELVGVTDVDAGIKKSARYGAEMDASGPRSLSRLTIAQGEFIKKNRGHRGGGKNKVDNSRHPHTDTPRIEKPAVWDMPRDQVEL